MKLKPAVPNLCDERIEHFSIDSKSIDKSDPDKDEELA